MGLIRPPFLISPPNDGDVAVPHRVQHPFMPTLACVLTGYASFRHRHGLKAGGLDVVAAVHALDRFWDCLAEFLPASRETDNLAHAVS
jgi:hypothetical protein